MKLSAFVRAARVDFQNAFWAIKVPNRQTAGSGNFLSMLLRGPGDALSQYWMRPGLDYCGNSRDSSG